MFKWNYHENNISNPLKTNAIDLNCRTPIKQQSWSRYQSHHDIIVNSTNLSTDIEKAMLSIVVCREGEGAEEELFQFMTSVLDLIVKPVTLSN